MSLIDPELLAILACPRCRGVLRLSNTEQALFCAECELVYPVNTAGVPLMTVEDD